jgi:hypothetical protein
MRLLSPHSCLINNCPYQPNVLAELWGYNYLNVCHLFVLLMFLSFYQNHSVTGLVLESSYLSFYLMREGYLGSVLCVEGGQ